RGQEAAVFVAVRVAEHHLLDVAAALEQLAVVRDGEKVVHDPAASAQIADGLEQRDDVDGGPRLAAGNEQARFLEQQRDLEHVAGRGGHRDDVGGNRGWAVARVQAGGDVER